MWLLRAFQNRRTLLKFFIYYYPKRELLCLPAGFISFLISAVLHNSKKIITIIDGGLGSQMGQYAAGQIIEKKTGIPVYHDITWFEKCGTDCSGLVSRNYILEKTFPLVKVKKASTGEILFYKIFLNTFYNKNDYCFTLSLEQIIEQISTSKESCYLGQYYQVSSPGFVKELRENVRKQFIFDTTGFSEITMQMAEVIKTTPCPIALFVRRGDFITLGWDKATPPEYFYKAIREIENRILEYSSNKWTFFVFSDDIPYCKELFSSCDENFVFVNILDEEGMYLGSLCRHFILSAKSGFGLWSAFLSSVDSNKIVMQPKEPPFSDLPEKITV